MSSFNFDLSNLSDEQLNFLESHIQKEKQRRNETKNTKAILKWGSQENNKASFSDFETNKGWLTCLVIFKGDQMDSYKSIGKTKEESQENASKQAVLYSGLISDDELPKELIESDPMEIF